VERERGEEKEWGGERECKDRKGEEGKEEMGRKRDEKTLWICSPRKKFCSTTMQKNHTLYTKKF